MIELIEVIDPQILKMVWQSCRIGHIKENMWPQNPKRRVVEEGVMVALKGTCVTSERGRPRYRLDCVIVGKVRLKLCPFLRPGMALKQWGITVNPDLSDAA